MLRKYIDLLLANIRTQMDDWFDLSQAIEHEEVCRFLHSVKGTAGTLQMVALSELSSSLLEQLDPISDYVWTPHELRTFLMPIIKITYTTGHGQELESKDPIPTRAEIPSEQPLVLILDDDVALLQFLKEELELRGFFVIATVNPNQAIHYFHDLWPDCLILDLIIPEKNGFEVIDTLKDRISKGFIPTTIISTDTRKESRLRAFDMGADDFLNKPLDMDELLARLNRQMRKKKQIDNLLFMDELTGVMNRKYLDEAYVRLCRERNRLNINFSLAVIDLDYFKKVNDQHGHLVGDKVLLGFTSYMKENIRTADILIRFGGEEFVLLLPQTSAAEARQILERLLSEFSALELGAPDASLRMTFSAGVVEVLDAEPQKCREWLSIADLALYEAKERGRNRVEIGYAGMVKQTYSRKLNIAIIDDDAIIRALLLESLQESMGGIMPVEVRAYRDGEMFFADPWHAQSSPFLVVLDGVMPKMDGLEVLERIRMLPRSSMYSVIMLTGRKEENDIVRALQLGADDYLTKPFHIGELEARMKRLLTRMNLAIKS